MVYPMSYLPHLIRVRFLEREDKDPFYAIVSVGDTAPEDGSEDDKQTFYAFSNEDWEHVVSSLEKGEMPIIDGDFAIEEIVEPDNETEIENEEQK